MFTVSLAKALACREEVYVYMTKTWGTSLCVDTPLQLSKLLKYDFSLSPDNFVSFTKTDWMGVCELAQGYTKLTQRSILAQPRFTDLPE